MSAVETMFDPRKTLDIQNLVVQWSNLPFANLINFLGPGYRYGYIGTEDLTMWPLITPGAVVQINPSLKRIRAGTWRRETERPIYFIETRTGFSCGWCAMEGETLIVQPHPLSPAAVKVFRFREEAEVIGQVVGVAMQLDSGAHNAVSERSNSKL